MGTFTSIVQTSSAVHRCLKHGRFEKVNVTSSVCKVVGLFLRSAPSCCWISEKISDLNVCVYCSRWAVRGHTQHRAAAEGINKRLGYLTVAAASMLWLFLLGIREKPVQCLVCRKSCYVLVNSYKLKASYSLSLSMEIFVGFELGISCPPLLIHLVYF